MSQWCPGRYCSQEGEPYETSHDTPNPMGFLNDILERPANEKPFVLLVVGHAADDAQVPAIARKPFEEVVTAV